MAPLYSLETSLRGGHTRAALRPPTRPARSARRARHNHTPAGGTTAVSTVFGSNIFDILIALALPWAIYSSIFGPITVFESLGFGTAYALTTIMIATFALFVILSATNAWVVTHPHAWVYLAIYAAFVVYVILDAIPGIVPGPARSTTGSASIALSTPRALALALALAAAMVVSSRSAPHEPDLE